MALLQNWSKNKLLQQLSELSSICRGKGTRPVSGSQPEILTIPLASRMLLDCQVSLAVCFLINLNIDTHPSPSSVEFFHFNVIGKGATSVMENSRTLNAGERIAHWIGRDKKRVM